MPLVPVTAVFAALAAGLFAYAPEPAPPPQAQIDDGRAPDPDKPRPIALRESVWVEELTWMEVRDAMAGGVDTILIGTGGVEQNGPYTVSGKHNYIMRATTEAIARNRGKTLIAPIVPFVPEGRIDPPEGYMRYPPTISVEEDTYRALLRDIVRSFRAHGFKNIVLLGDSGGNQAGMEAVATDLDAQWRDNGTRVIYVPEFYDWEDRSRWLAVRGYEQVPEGIHDELSVQAILMTLNPNLIRLEERRAAGLASINGISVEDEEQIAELGRALIDHISEQTISAIASRLEQKPQ